MGEDGNKTVEGLEYQAKDLSPENQTDLFQKSKSILPGLET